ncbi:MAG: branched-chain amino acid ABC transporter substrate-binding protein [Rhodospirillales bacterium]|nr:branched-chain amino acid ABC transporter substrate-binding protein [Rhodospirillales bacterium]
MRNVPPIGRTSVLAAAVSAILACSSGFAAGPIGEVEIERGEPIEIRALLSESVVTSVSPLIGTAIGLAIEDFGPIHGHPVSIEILDEKCSGEGGRAAAEIVAADARVVGVIGTLCSGAAVEASPILSAAGLSMISPANTSPRLTSDLAGNVGPDYYEGYYRVTDNDLIEASVVAHFSYDELGLRTMGTIHDGDAYTSAIANAFAVEVRAHGGDVPVIARVEKGQTDMATVLAKFVAAAPDGVFIPLFQGEAIALIQQAAKSDAMDGVTMVGGAATLTTDLLALPESEGLYFTAPDPGDSGNTNQATGKSAADVLAAFEVVFGGPPTSSYWAHGYDATTLLLSAIEQVAVVDGETLSVDRAALRDALDGTTNFQGILGTLTCDEFGDCGIGRSVVRLHEDSSVTDPALLPIVYRGAWDSHVAQD